MPARAKVGFDRHSILIASLITELARLRGQEVTVELFEPAQQCDSCHGDEEVLVAPKHVCSRCWLRAVMQSNIAVAA